MIGKKRKLSELAEQLDRIRSIVEQDPDDWREIIDLWPHLAITESVRKGRPETIAALERFLAHPSVHRHEAASQLAQAEITRLRGHA